MSPTTILLVEDDPAILEMMREVLAEEGYQVIAAATITCARRALDAAQPELLILDLHVETPYSGRQLHDELRHDPRWGDVPVLFCTADVRFVRTHGARIEATGAQIIQKPFGVADLLAMVGATVSGRVRTPAR